MKYALFTLPIFARDIFGFQGFSAVGPPHDPFLGWNFFCKKYELIGIIIPSIKSFNKKNFIFFSLILIRSLKL